MTVRDLLPTVLALVLATAVSAQPAPQQQYQIAVTTTGDQCTYTIRDHADQDLFRVEPDGEVQFMPRGPRVVKVTVQPDPESGIEGGEGVRQMWVTNSRPRDFPVRADLGRETSHEVVIECCTVGNRRQTCPDDRLVRAVAEGESVGGVQDSGPGESASGPSAGDPPAQATDPRRVGPRMVVVD